MPQSAGQEIRAIAETLSALPAQITGATNDMSNAAMAMTKSMKELVEQIESAGNRAGRMLERKGIDVAGKVAEGSAEVLVDFKSTVDRLWQRVDELSRTIVAVEAGIGNHVSALAGVTRSARETEVAMTGSAKSLTNATQPLTRTGELLTQSMG
ncbi:hypothetical protein CCP4SC76_380001 [Gammaproteobacteria bacterium]